MKRAAYVVSVLLAGCTPPRAASVGLPPLVGTSAKADGDPPQIVPMVKNEVLATFDASSSYTYDGNTQLGLGTTATTTTFTADIIVVDGPCGDATTCMFKADALGVWPAAIRLALYTRPAGGGVADWQPLRASDLMNPLPESKCGPKAVEQRAQVMDRATFVHFVDEGGVDCGYLTTSGTALAANAQLGVMVYPTAGADAYDYRVAITRVTPPVAPAQQ